MRRFFRKTILIPAAALCAGAVLWFGAAGGGLRPAAPGIVFVTIDTLRADHLQSYGYPRPTSPFIDSLAREGIRFANALSASSHTAPSHASIFTGLFPFQHNLLGNGERLNPDIPTIAGIFKRRGYCTAAVSAVRFMENLFGFDGVGDEGQPLPRIPVGETGAKHRRRWYRNAQEQVDRAIKWLGGVKSGRPFFIWVHLYDVHQWAGKRQLPPEYRAQFAAAGDRSGLIEYLSRRQNISASFFGGEAGLLDAVNGYDGRLRFADDQLRRLHGYMEQRGLNEDAWWFITADHGEGLGNHDYAGHGEHIYNEQLHVPLIIRRPQGAGGGAVRRELVRTVDLFATLMDLAPERGGPPPVGVQGRSLVRLLERDAPAEPGAVYSFAQRRPREERGWRSKWEEGEIFALQDLNFKYIYHSNGRHEFFDLNKDPFELRNLIEAEAEHREEEKMMREKLHQLTENAPRLNGGFKNPKLNPDTLKELQALGYM